MKVTGVIRRVDDLGRIVIPKEIRRTLRIREGGSAQTTLTLWETFCFAIATRICHHITRQPVQKNFCTG